MIPVELKGNGKRKGEGEGEKRGKEETTEARTARGSVECLIQNVTVCSEFCDECLSQVLCEGNGTEKRHTLGS